MKIILLTQEAPLYLPDLVGVLVQECRQELWAATVLSPYGSQGLVRSLARLAAMFGPRAFLRLTWIVATGRLADAWRHVRGDRPLRSVRGILAQAGIRFINTRNVTDPNYLERLRAEAPDLILSLSCPQILPAPLLALPRLGCINYHSSLLPRYRGLFSPFWALAEGASRTGVTVHLMTPTIDVGAVVAQREVPILAGDSLHALCQRSVATGALVLKEALQRIRAGTYDPSAVPDPCQGSYHSFPTALHGRQFRRSGKRFF